MKFIRRRKKEILLLLILFFTVFSTYFSDTRSNTRQGMLFWEALFSGRFFQYYSVGSEARSHGLMIHYPNYDIVLNFLMGLWQLPLYIAEKLIGCKDIILYSALARMYSKIYLVFVLLACGRETARISGELGCSKEEQTSVFYLFTTAVTALSSALVVAQVDVIGLFFILRALYHALRGEDKKYFLCFVLAVQCKFFAVFFVLPVVILRNKKIYRMVAELAAPVAINILLSVPFRLLDPAGYGGKGARLAEMVEEMLKTHWNFLGYTIPSLFFLYVGVSLLAFFIDVPEEKKKEYLFWFAFLGTIAMFLTMSNHPHWYIYLAPYTTIYLFLRREKRMKRLFLESVSHLALAVGFMINNYWAFSAIGMMPLGEFLKKCFPEHIVLEDLYIKFGHMSYYMAWTVVYAVYVVWLLAVAVYHNPFKTIGEDKNAAVEDIRPWIPLRALANALLVNASLWLCMMPVKIW